MADDAGGGFPDPGRRPTGRAPREVPPVAWTTIPEMMREVARREGAREAVVDGEVRLDFAALHAQTLRFAAALAAAGIGGGDRVAIWASNGWRWVVAASGIWQVGATVVPLASRWRAAEVAPLLRRTGARLLVVDAESAGERLLDNLITWGAGAVGGGDRGEGGREGRGADEGGVGVRGRGAIAGLPALERIVVLDGAGRADAVGARGPDFVGWEAFMASGERHATPDGRAARPDGIAEILFTSGTTGSPKGVELAHAQLLSAYWDWSGIGGLVPGDRFLVIPPYSHGFGMNGGVLACWMRAVANVPVAVFDPRSTLAAIARERISVISGPPTLFATLMDHPDFDPAKTCSLRTAFVGAAAVPTELIRAMRGRMGIGRVINAYGLIEVCVVSMTRADDPESVVSTTTGRAMPGVEVRIVKEVPTADAALDASTVEDVPDGEPGEVWVRSQGVMRGYLDDPEQTAAAIVAGGWCRTGDVGVRDAEGHVRVVDRLKDAYNCGGFSAHPAEIESQLLEHPAVAQAAVVGVADARMGEVGHAFVVLREDVGLEPATLIAWARERMASYKVPRRVHRVAAFPLNASGKVRKDELRRIASEAAGCADPRSPE